MLSTWTQPNFCCLTEQLTPHKNDKIKDFIQVDSTFKLVLETTCIKRIPALRDHCFDRTTVLKST